MPMTFLHVVVISALVAAALCSHSILDFGGVPNKDNNDAAFTNSRALTKAFMAANSSADRTVLVPADTKFFFFYIEIYNLHNITFQVDGELVISNNITAWPTTLNHVLAALYFADCDTFTIQGSGLIDGQGYDWWVYVFLTTVDNRPHMFTIERCTNLWIHHIYVRNSPQYHYLLMDVKDVVVEDLSIFANITDQKAIMKEHGMLGEGEIPIFPLNTDGIDPSGINVLIRNVTIENFDDAVAVKPQNQGNKYSSCSQNMTIRDSHVKYGVGMTIGSVPPNANVNCIRNITFENITFQDPFKAIYIKTNPGDVGTGLIENILYRNITAVGSIWYPIWIGPQQERQPGTPGTGCNFLFPINEECPTQVRVPIRDIRVIDSSFTNGHTLPGVLLCNSTVPCTGFVFDNVINTGIWDVQQDYWCENVEGTTEGSKPPPPCF